MSQPQMPSKEIWIRGLYIIMYFVIFYILWMVLIAVAVLQFVSSLVFKTSNRNLENFGQSLSIYVQDIIRFVTYNTEKKPFPFDNWPTTKKYPDISEKQ